MTPAADRSFEDLAADLERLSDVVARWEDEQQKGTVQAIRRTLEALHRAALVRLVRSAREVDGGVRVLRATMEDPTVRALFAYHRLIEAPPPSLEQRIEAALESVRPQLAEHEGDVSLVSAEPPTAEIRLLGSCHGCAHSEVTVRYGIEEAIKAAAPEIERVVVVPAERAEELVGLRGLTASPFERHWTDAGPADAVPEGGMVAVELDRMSVLLTRVGDEVRAFPNACMHLGLPLDGGTVHDGILTCPFHQFEFVLATGECLTAPEAQLPRLPSRVKAGRVEVSPEGSP